MPSLETFLVGLATRGAYDLTKAGAEKAFKIVTKHRPELISQAERAAATGDDAGLRDALAGAVEVAAASGQVVINGAATKAVRSALFDHQWGFISIGGTTLEAPVLTMGGSVASAGQTHIGGETTMRGGGSFVQVGDGAFIHMTGDDFKKLT